MKLCTETITIYNAKYDTATGYDVYNRSVISGVSWFCDIASNVDGSGLKAANKFIIRIPVTADFRGRSYLPPNEYAETATPENYFTLREGDLIVRGEATEENPRPAELHKNYSEVATILRITDDRRGQYARHWKVVGA